MESSPLKVVRLWETSEEGREDLLKRSELDIEEVTPSVEEIVSEVRKNGDHALLEYTKKFDRVELEPDGLKVSDEEFSRAYSEVSEDDIEAIKSSAEAIERYHMNNLPEGWEQEFEPGVCAGRIVRPLKRVGVYVPGGTARYPSTVLMATVPARIAGVKEVFVCTPPNPEGEINSAVLVAADVAGADDVFKVGGGQAIASMAYGSETVPKVQKIVGPGNIYVTAAKKLVSADVGIDFLAGPSEVVVFADSKADPRFVALDMAAQAEHDPASAALLVTTSSTLADKVVEEVSSVLEDTPRKETILEAFERYGGVVVVRDLSEGINFVNDYAPEHLELFLENAEEVLDHIENAGAIFVGEYTPTAAGDFAVGPNHILPTGGDAKRFDGLSVYNFLRLPSVESLTREGLERVSEVVERLADLEGLPAHAQSIRERLEGGENEN